MFKNTFIRDLSGHSYSFAELVSFLDDLPKEEIQFDIGTDSQIDGDRLCIVSCFCVRVLDLRKIFYVKEKFSEEGLKAVGVSSFIISNADESAYLRLRMLFEAFRSIELALELAEFCRGKISIHLDVGETDASKTSQFQNEIAFIVKSQGFECFIKPDSWAASCVADKVIKN